MKMMGKNQRKKYNSITSDIKKNNVCLKMTRVKILSPPYQRPTEYYVDVENC